MAARDVMTAREISHEKGPFSFTNTSTSRLGQPRADTTLKETDKWPQRPANLSRFEGIKPPQRCFPNSTYDLDPKCNEKPEVEALTTILESALQDICVYENTTFASIDLDNFCVYWWPRRSTDGIPEFISLRDIYTHKLNDTYYFDGTVIAGCHCFYIRRVPFKVLSIGGLCSQERASVGDDIWIASIVSETFNVRYRLKVPEEAYRRFHEPFIWTANLCKHVMDYLDHQSEDEKTDVKVQDFAAKFSKVICAWHCQSASFADWFKQYGHRDFRRALSSCVDFLLSQAISLGLAGYSLWNELNCVSLPYHPPSRKHASKTVVTPFVYSCLSQSWFSHLLTPVPPTSKSPRMRLWKQVFDPDQRFTTRSLQIRANQSPEVAEINVGDVVMVKPDENMISNWKQDRSEVWCAYVHTIIPTEQGLRFKVLWLDSPSHTSIAASPYIYLNELFMTDHCNCKDELLQVEDIIGLEQVTFFAIEPTTEGFFVRQTSFRDDCSFRTLEQDHFICDCNKDGASLAQFSRHDTVLVRGLSSAYLEPVCLLENTVGKTYVGIRRFVRRNTRISGEAALANELLYTDETRPIKTSQIVRRCSVKIVRPGQSPPTPYSAGGVGHLFFVQHALIKEAVVALPPILDFVEDMDTTSTIREPLGLLDLFCGCGNLGFGIEDSGVAKVVCAVDLNGTAIHTYNANLKPGAKCALHWGSVDDLLEQALKGDFRHAPSQHDVSIIAAGTPCQGFSILNTNKSSAQSLKNVSMIASMLSYVDFYRPHYVVIENVVNMARSINNQNALSQIVACLVSMAYQVQQSVMNACEVGAGQSRNRIFITATAPGLTTLHQFEPSHSSPPGSRISTLGTAPNGQPFGVSESKGLRAFSHVSIGQATAHLPSNTDGRTPSIKYPDHLSLGSSLDQSALWQVIPRFPKANLAMVAKYWKTRVPPFSFAVSRTSFKNKRRIARNSRSAGRLDADRPMPVITRGYDPLDAWHGRLLHWSEDRPVTIEEARIAQQIPHDFVLLGSLQSRWSMIGNAVCRGVAQAWGISLRGAIEANEATRNKVRNNFSRQNNRLCGGAQLSQTMKLEDQVPRDCIDTKTCLPPSLSTNSGAKVRTTECATTFSGRRRPLHEPSSQPNKRACPPSRLKPDGFSSHNVRIDRNSASLRASSVQENQRVIPGELRSCRNAVSAFLPAPKVAVSRGNREKLIIDVDGIKEAVIVESSLDCVTKQVLQSPVDEVVPKSEIVASELRELTRLDKVNIASENLPNFLEVKCHLL